MRFRASLCACVFALLSLASACKQDKGDVCQVDSDCNAPLVCSASTRTCQPVGSGDNLTDGAPLDAPLPADAAPADAGEPDAAPVDAGEPDAAAAM